MPDMSAIGYRPDIDGLRAIAVLAVVLYHARLPGVSGGFMGVDVFFVISGFLITSIILKDLQAGTFSFAGFWERRARRILPALVLVIVATVAAGWFMLVPTTYAALGREVAMQSIFASNFLFYKEAGYFDWGAGLRPLIHTWSLAVEEQFYLLYPPALYIVWRFARRFVLPFLIGSAFLSFGLCLMVLDYKALAFYMLPFRIWEFMAGALIVQCAAYGQNISALWRNVVTGAGLVLILTPVFFYTHLFYEHNAFVRFFVVMPCVGTAAIIWAGMKGETCVGRMLSWRPVVFVGLVSYSWYLWHWPILVFARYIPGVFDAAVGALCLAGSFGLAVLSWKFVEQPFRTKAWLPKRKDVYGTALIALSLLAITGMSLHDNVGYVSRMKMSVADYSRKLVKGNPHRQDCDQKAVAEIEKDAVCQTLPGRKASFMLWGDSHADAAAPAFYELSKKFGKNGYVATYHGCPPALGYAERGWNTSNHCVAYNRAIFDFIVRNKIKHVFLVSSWISWIDTPGEEPVEVLLQHTIDALSKEGVKVYLLLDVPSATYNSTHVIGMEALYGRKIDVPLVARGDYLKHRNEALKPITDTVHGAVIIDPVDRMCPDEFCKVEEDGQNLYYDQNHISMNGALYLAPLFEPYFGKDF